MIPKPITVYDEDHNKTTLLTMSTKILMKTSKTPIKLYRDALNKHPEREPITTDEVLGKATPAEST